MPAVIVPDLTEVARQWPAGWFLHGQCRLVYLDAMTVRLMPHQGNFLWIDGHPRLIPDAGVPLPGGGLSDTNYLVAASMNGDEIALQTVPLAVGHQTSPGLGIEVLADNPRATLVGMVRLVGSQFTPALVLSWHHRRTRVFRAYFVVARGSTATAAAEVNPEIRIAFLTWVDECVRQRIMATVKNTTDGCGVYTACAIDGLEGSSGSTVNSSMSPGWTTFSAMIESVRVDLSEGYHVATLLGYAVGGGAASWAGPYGAIPQTTNTVELIG